MTSTALAVAPGAALAAPVGIRSTADVARGDAVQRGEDLTAWQLIEVQRLEGDAAVAAYRGFIEAYGASPLAVVAWGRLVGLGQSDVAWRDDTTLRQTLGGIRRQWEQAQRLVSEGSQRRAVADASDDLVDE